MITLRSKFPKMLVWRKTETRKWHLKNKMGDRMITTEKP